MRDLDPGDLLDTLDVGVVVHDLDTSIRYVNAAACRLLGLSRSDMLTKSSSSPNWDLVSPDGTIVTPNDQPVMRAIASDSEVRGIVLGVRLPDTSERRWLRVDAVPVRRDGKTARILVSFLDVSGEYRSVDEARRAQAATEDRYAATLRAMSEGVVVHEPSGAIGFANPAASRILGLTADQMRGVEAIDPRWQLVTPEGQPLPASQIPSEITRATGQACHDVLLGVHRADGERAWLAVSTDAFGGPGLANQRVVATFTDVTPQREMQLALEATNARFAAVTSAVPGVLYQAHLRFDGTLTMAFVAGDTEALVGLTPDAILAPGFDVRSLLHAGDAAAALAELGGDATTRIHTAEFRLKRGDEWIWARARATAVNEEGGLLFTGVLFDITEEKRLRANVDRAQRREVMGELSAGIAHNFNNALAAVLPNLSELRAHTTVEGRAILDEAVTAAERASDLVRQLMRLARGERDEAPQLVDVRAVVADVAKLCKRTFDRTIAIRTVDRAPGAAFTRGQTTQLHQALLNLCVNARDALDGRPTPQIDIVLDRTRRAVGRGDPVEALVVTVRDNGAGMSAADLKHVGEPFFTTKEPGRGTGLGVASAMRVAREMNGEVHIESTLGTGTSFHFVLPAADARPGAKEAPATTTTQPRADLRVLIVDDEPLVRAALARMWKRLATHIETVSDGSQALARIDRDDDIDLVLLDLSMPGVPGREVLELIANKRPTLPVAVMSGDIGDGRGLERAAAILEKPLVHRQLEELVARLFPNGGRRTIS